MEFTTKVAIEPTFFITHQDKMIMMGSCFSENIGRYLQQYRFNVRINPFGIMYNPLSIFYSLERIARKRLYTEAELLEHNDLYISLDHHGSFSDTDKNVVLEKINSEIEQAHAHFKECKYIFLTPGTSFVYHHLQQNKIVANCHKIPHSSFEKKLLNVDEIINAFENIQAILNDKIILFTVSPVRHWRDGAVENQRSKSILIESIHQLMAKNKNCHYFPAYEIMMDELRDYRFYAEDMLHPNAVAVKYIWERFSETYFTKETSNINKKIEKIILMQQHRVRKKNSEEEKTFRTHLEKTIAAFKQDHPMITLDLLP